MICSLDGVTLFLLQSLAIATQSSNSSYPFFILKVKGKIITLFVYLAISAATSADTVGICKSPDVELPEVTWADDVP